MTVVVGDITYNKTPATFGTGVQLNRCLPYRFLEIDLSRTVHP
jgi:hypothetical protein